MSNKKKKHLFNWTKPASAPATAPAIPATAAPAASPASPTPTPAPAAPVSTYRKLVGEPAKPTLRFTPYAWAKLQFLRKLATTELCGFGLASDPQQPLLITDFHLLPQTCTSVSAEIEEDAIANHFDRMVDAGYQPFQFFRVWLHTHPNMGASPSGTDIDTFYGTFGKCDWCVMFILGETTTTCKLRFNTGPGGTLDLPFTIDWSLPFPAANQAAWQEEFKTCIHKPQPSPSPALTTNLTLPGYWDSQYDYDRDHNTWEVVDDEPLAGEDTYTAPEYRALMLKDLPTHTPARLRKELEALDLDDLEEAVEMLKYFTPHELQGMSVHDLVDVRVPMD